MNVHPLQLTIPQPCAQDWNNMRPNGQGRFCDHCRQTVTDFSKMTDAALLAHIQQHGMSCGRFREDQLDRVIALPEMPPSRFWQRLLLTAGMLFGLQKAAGAQHNRPASTTIAAQPTERDTVLTVEGVVRGHDGQPAIGAIVTVQDAKTGVKLAAGVADIDGYYRLPILQNAYEEQTVAVHYHFQLDDLKTTLKLDRCRNVQDVVIPLTIRPVVLTKMGAPMAQRLTINVIVPVTWKKRFHHKIQRLVRRSSKQKDRHSK